MIRLKTGIKALLLSAIAFWMVGCQQTSPLGLGQRYYSQPTTQQQTQPTVDYNNLFNNKPAPKPPANNPPAPQQAQTSCAKYTAPAQSVITSCEPTIASYAGDVAEIAPDCYGAFQALTPNTSCSVLIPQLNSVLNACKVLFTNPTYSSYLPQSCNSAVQSLLKS